MKLFQQTDKNDFNREQALECIPVINKNVLVRHMDKGELLLSYPMNMKPWFISLHKRFSRSPGAHPGKKLQLDSLGSQVWKLINSKNTVRDIVTLFAETNDLTLQESEMSVTAFLRNLGRRGLIVIAEGEKQ